MITCFRRIASLDQFRNLALACIAILASSTAVAEVVNLRFTGITNSVGSALTPYFAVNDPFTYTVSYDTATTGTYSGDFSRTFQAISAVFSVNATGGAWSTAINDPEIQIDDSASFSRITFQAGHDESTRFSNPIVNGKTLLNAELRLYSDDVNMVTGFTTLPSDIPLSGWSTSVSSTGVYVYWDSGLGSEFLRLQITSIQKLSAVPEPSTYALIGGLCAFGGVLWHRRRTRQTERS